MHALIGVRDWWLVPPAILILLSAPAMASEASEATTGPSYTLDLNTRDLIYQRLTAARGLPAGKRAELRRQLLKAVLKGTTDRPDATLHTETLDPPPADTLTYDEAITQVLDLISQAESHAHGYDAVQHRAVIPPSKPPTKMTLREIFAWIEATPNQQHAIGRYQIIPSTLRHLKAKLNLSDDALFDRHLQDRMAVQLLDEAGLDDYRSGLVDSETFMDELAMVWAGLPLNTGLSAYHGMNGNRATMTRASYESQFRRIFWGYADAPPEERKD